jgi:IS5 family transposase
LPDHRSAPPLVRLTKTVDWNRLDELFGATYSPDQGRPAISTRLMVSLHYLIKYMHNLSDEDVLSGWVENRIDILVNNAG